MAKPEYKGFDIFDREPGTYNNLTEHQKRCVDELRDENLQARNKATRFQAENDDLRREVDKLNEENKQLKADNDKLRHLSQTFAGWYVKAVEENEKSEQDEPTISIKNACMVLNQWADAYQEEIDELKKENETLKAKKSDKLTVTVNAEHIKSELDDLYQEFKELEKSYDALHDEHDELKERIKGHVERLAYDYDFKEMPNGAGLHYCHDFREIADTVGAKIPNAPFMTARIKAPNVLGDLNNAKIKDIDADKITSGTLKALEIGKKMSEGFEKGVKEAEPFPVMSDKEIFGDKLASADLGEAEIINPQTVYFKKAVEQSLKDLDKRIVDALKQALDIKSPTEPTEGPLKVTKHTHGDGENDGTESNAQRELNKNQKLKRRN